MTNVYLPDNLIIFIYRETIMSWAGATGSGLSHIQKWMGSVMEKKLSRWVGYPIYLCFFLVFSHCYHSYGWQRIQYKQQKSQVVHKKSNLWKQVSSRRPKCWGFPNTHTPNAECYVDTYVNCHGHKSSLWKSMKWKWQVVLAENIKIFFFCNVGSASFRNNIFFSFSMNIF